MVENGPLVLNSDRANQVRYTRPLPPSHANWRDATEGPKAVGAPGTPATFISVVLGEACSRQLQPQALSYSRITERLSGNEIVRRQFWIDFCQTTDICIRLSVGAQCCVTCSRPVCSRYQITLVSMGPRIAQTVSAVRYQARRPACQRFYGCRRAGDHL